MPITKSVLLELEDILGPHSIVREEADKQSYMREWRGRMVGKSPAVLLPRSVEQIAAVVRICARENIPLVPQGGNTGLVGAGVPDETGTALLLSLKHMNKVRRVNADDFSMEVEAGCILHDVKATAATHDRFVGITLASEGSATIGGLAATNAGGSFTLRYGNMRENVLGLEAVMPDGRIWNNMQSLRKDNSGYDLKQLLIGSEGTLGIITAATLRLMPRPTKIETAFVALESPSKALALMAALRAETQDALAAFELLPQIAVESAVQHVKGCRAPFAKTYPWIALIEIHGTGTRGPILENILGTLFEKGLLVDAACAQTTAHAQEFWALREGVVEAQKYLGASLKHDISVPIGSIPALIENGCRLAAAKITGVRPYTFGHVGDGNIHFNLSPPVGMNDADFTAKREEIAEALHDLTLELGGSISAEHGIGRFKRAEFHRTARPEKLGMMKAIKQALDPQNIMNPGVIF